MNLTKLEIVKLGVTLMSSKLIAGKLEQGESSYEIAAAGKALKLANIETPTVKKGRGQKTQQVIDLINEGITNKQITDRVGCDASHVSHIRSMLFIQAENAKPENKELTNEQFSAKTGKTMYLVNLFRK